MRGGRFSLFQFKKCERCCQTRGCHQSLRNDNINDLLKLRVARIAIFQPSNIGVGDMALVAVDKQSFKVPFPSHEWNIVLSILGE